LARRGLAVRDFVGMRQLPFRQGLKESWKCACAPPSPAAREKGARSAG